jgi:hypothetical protein
MEKSTTGKRGFCALKKPLPAPLRSCRALHAALVLSASPPRSPLPPAFVFARKKKNEKPCANPPVPSPPKLLGPPGLLPAKDQPAGVGKQPQKPCFSRSVRVLCRRRISCFLVGFLRCEMVMPATGPAVARSVLVSGSCRMCACSALAA